MTEIVRDRRTAFAAIVLPALTMPAVVLATPALFRWQQQTLRASPSRVILLGTARLGPTDGAAREAGIQFEASPNPRGALLRGDIDAIVTVQPGRMGRTGVLEVLYDDTRPASAAALAKVTGLMGTVMAQSIASPERRGRALLAAALPLFLAVWVLLGGQYAALDVGVGERERGSLEGLLAMPPPGTALVAGKFLAVLVPALVALLGMLISGTVALAAGGGLLGTGEIRVSLPLGVAARLLAVGMALAGLLSAAQLVVSLAASTLREAQQAFTGLYLLVALPGTLVTAGWVAPKPGWVSLLPGVNAAEAVRAILMGEFSTIRLAATIASLGVLIPPLLLLGARRLRPSGSPNR